MIMAGPGIQPNTTTDVVGSHVDLAPTWLALAGMAPGVEMDGRSVAHHIINTSMPELSSSVSQQLRVSESAAAPRRPPQTAYIEYHGLGPVGAPRRMMDSFNNTYRALRIIDNSTYGNILYAEFGTDFLFSGIQFREFYNLDQVGKRRCSFESSYM